MDLPRYLQENYGVCEAVHNGVSHCRCRCSRPGCDCGGVGWLGTCCSDWKPFNVQNFDELRDAQRALVEAR